MLRSGVKHKLSVREENLLKVLSNELQSNTISYLTEMQIQSKLNNFDKKTEKGIVYYKFNGEEKWIIKMILFLFREYHPFGYNTTITKFKHNSGIYEVNMYRWSSCD